MKKIEIIFERKSFTQTKEMAQSMELVNEPELYCLVKNDSGDYVDYIPLIHKFKGVKCECGTRKNTVIFYSKKSFDTHTKTHQHETWVKNTNLTKENRSIECENLKADVANLKILNTLQGNEIAKLKHNIIMLEQDKKMNLQFIQSLTQQQLRDTKDNNIMDLS